MIALTTPTGNIGSKVLVHLLEAGRTDLRVLARDPGRLPDTARETVEVVQGSLDNPADLRGLLEGANSLFWCQPDTPAAPDYVGAYEALARRGADAIRESGLSHVVAISAAGEPGTIPAGPITALHRMENLLAETPASIRFLRCGSFFENLLWQWDQIVEQGWFTYPAPGDVPGPQVGTADIARVAAELLRNPEWVGQEAVPLLGPTDLTYTQMAEMLSVAIGEPVFYQPSEPDAYGAALQSLGQSPDAARALIDMFDFLATSYSPPAADRSLTPLTLTAWLNR